MEFDCPIVLTGVCNDDGPTGAAGRDGSSELTGATGPFGPTGAFGTGPQETLPQLQVQPDPWVKQVA